MKFSRQEYWSGLPIPSPRDLPDPAIEPRSPALQADSLPSEPPGKPPFIGNLYNYITCIFISINLAYEGTEVRVSTLHLNRFNLCRGASLVAQMVKNPSALRETWVGSLGWEDSLEKGMATHSSILAGRIPWTEEPGGLQSIGLQGVRHD